MGLTTYDELEQRSPEWYAARAGIVTASMVGSLINAGIVGPMKYGCEDCGAVPDEPCRSKASKATKYISTLHGLRVAMAEEVSEPLLTVADTETSRGWLLTLAAERITGHVEETPVTGAMQRGIEDEPLARAHYAEHYAPVEEVGFMVREDNGIRLGFSPDGLVHDDGLVEFKSRLQKKQVDVFLRDEVPAINYAQLQCGLLVSGREWIDYCSFTPGMPMYRKRVFPDPSWVRAITSAVADAEERIEQIVTTYTAATEGLPVTEPRLDLDDIVI